MSQAAIEKLTPEQEILISTYCKKWQKLVFSTEQIDRKIAEKAVKAAYAIIGYEEPKIIFCGSPYAAFMTLRNQGPGSLEVGPEYCLSSELWSQIKNQIGTQLTRFISQQNGELECLISQYKRQLTLQIRCQAVTLHPSNMKG